MLHCDQQKAKTSAKVNLQCNTCKKEFVGYRRKNRIKRYCSVHCSAVDRGIGKRKSSDWLRLGNCWRGMKSRCYRSDMPYYAYYGARGIIICEEWKSNFQAFYDWSMSNGYAPDLEIDRIDPNGNYDPSNCRWANRTQQMRNTRKRRNAKTSKFRGVSWCANANRWRVQVCIPGRSKHRGLFDNELDAARKYDDVVKEEFGEFASLNF